MERSFLKNKKKRNINKHQKHLLKEHNKKTRYNTTQGRRYTLN